MRIGMLTKFKRKKNLWISKKHPLYGESVEFKILYSATVLMHTRLNNTANPFSNIELERLITKGFSLISKDTITIMGLAKNVESLIDKIIVALDTPKKKLCFLLDLYNVSMTQYNISNDEQKSIDLFTHLLEIDLDTQRLLLNFISSAFCEEYENCLSIHEKMNDAKLPLTKSDLSYYMINYSYTVECFPKDILPGQSYYFTGNCVFHGTIHIPSHTTVHISNAVVYIKDNFSVSGGTFKIENSWVIFSSQTNSSLFEHIYINGSENSSIRFKNTTFQCCHNGGLLSLSNSQAIVEHCNIFDTSFVSAITCHGHSITVKNSNFKNCFAQKNGGAILIEHGTAQIQNCNFENCYAHNGGGIFSPNQTVISNCFFENCCAVEFGSAIFYSGEIRSNLEKCEYNNCHPKECAIVQYIGKRSEYIYTNTHKIRYSTIFDCVVRIKEYALLEAENATIYLAHTLQCNGIINMKNCKLFAYQMTDRDLIAFETSKNCSFTNCDFNGMEKHGIFRATRSRLHLSGCIFRNTANGRAIYNAFSPVIDGCIFSHCQEGALYCNSGRITNSKFINCRGRSGAGIIMYGSRGQIEYCSFTRCISEYSGGAIDISGGYHIVGCKYSECKPNNVS